jgi:hypothetical protein
LSVQIITSVESLLATPLSQMLTRASALTLRAFFFEIA